MLDIRCVGLTAGIDLASRPDAVGKRGYDAMEHGFNEENLMIRVTGDTIALTPPLIVSEARDRRDLRQGRPRDQGGGVAQARLARSDRDLHASRDSLIARASRTPAAAAGSPSRR